MERPFRASFTKGKTAVTTPTIVILKRPLSGLSEPGPGPGPGLLMAYCSAGASFMSTGWKLFRILTHVFWFWLVDEANVPVRIFGDGSDPLQDASKNPWARCSRTCLSVAS